ncbi:hypothetical protein CBS101457_005000 [Exobasidium rhododendri]|nr:hypothetical protein CBS101457_005000 [Exobasidium rhododendri]
MLVFVAFVTATLYLSYGADSSPHQRCTNDFSAEGRDKSVRCLFNQAKSRSLKLSTRQSKTFEEATREYRRRYEREPPSGFKQWLEWSKQNGATIIDDFDQIDANLRPFRTLSPQEMQKALNRVTGRKDPLDTIDIRSGKVHVPGDPTRGHIKAMHAVLDPIAPFLKDMQFVLNWDDREAVRGRAINPSDETRDPKKTDHGYGSDAWEFFTAPCPENYLSKGSTLGRPEINFCDNINNTALVDSRGDLQQGGVGISNLVPIMSWSKFSTSRDILVPHWAASTPTFRGWNREPDSIPFEQKSPTFYWRGTTTGSSMNAAHWRSNYRVRFVHYIQNLKASLVRARSNSSDTSFVQLSALGLQDTASNQRLLQTGLTSDMFDVGFTAAVQCDKEGVGCANLKKSIGFVKSADSGEEQKHQFLWDIDGNSMSGRFYRLLESNSLVFKQTLLGEWHDDRLIPWFHYVPVSFTSLKDIPHLLDYFINDSKGKKIAKEISAEGRKAVETNVRLPDLSIYWYRLLLEYGSLFE